MEEKRSEYAIVENLSISVTVVFFEMSRGSVLVPWNGRTIEMVCALLLDSQAAEMLIKIRIECSSCGFPISLVSYSPLHAQSMRSWCNFQTRTR